MLQLIAGHLVPTAGRVEVFGTNPHENEPVLQRMSLVKSVSPDSADLEEVSL